MWAFSTIGDGIDALKQIELPVPPMLSTTHRSRGGKMRFSPEPVVEALTTSSRWLEAKT